MVDKSKLGILKALRLAIYMQENADFFYDLLLGDKDTFRFSFKYLNVVYNYVEANLAPIGIIESDGIFKGHTMAQFTPMKSMKEYQSSNVSVLFMHANLLKYKHFGRSKVYNFNSFSYFKRCRDMMIVLQII